MIVIAPFAQKLRNGNNNPKNYPWWKEVVTGLLQQEKSVVQVGVTGEPQLAPMFLKNRPLPELMELTKNCETWISVDSFFQHFAWLECHKRGVVIFGQSDPNVFGHPQNLNLLKGRQYLRPVHEQFWLWEQCVHSEDSFVPPQVVLNAVSALLHK